MATQRISQVKGIDCTIDTFQPSRSNPVARRAVRKYYAQQPLNGTQTFDNLTFQVQQTDPLMVINEVRMVFPLEMRAYTGNSPAQLMNMAMAVGTRACNIAVAQDAPFSAFSNIEVGINGKVYSEQPQRYGKTLSKCFQSYSEMQFQNNHSLKPICNTLRENIRHRTVQVAHRDGTLTTDYVRIEQAVHHNISYALPLANSGFIARARAFQEGLVDDGYMWRGEINSLLNCAIFNTEARKQSNDQVPYVQDLFVNCTFAMNETHIDAQLRPANISKKWRVIPQKLFEFLTPYTSSFYRDQYISDYEIFPAAFELTWTGQPRLEIEWIRYQKPLLSEVYRLRGFQYQLDNSNVFRLPVPDRPENRQWVSTDLQRQLLSVPNLIYIWVEPTVASARTNFGWGGVFRTCDIRALKIRVNQNVEIIQDPSNRLLYKWFKRNTNNVQEYPTWEQCKVICISPSEIGLSDWIENDARLSTLSITCETALSRLQGEEYHAFGRYAAQRGIAEVDRLNWRVHPPELKNEWQLYPNAFEFSKEMGQAHITEDQQTLLIRWQLSEEPGIAQPNTPLDNHDEIIRTHFTPRVFRVEKNKEEFFINDIRRLYYRYLGYTFWIKVNSKTKQFGVAQNTNKLLFLVVEDSNFFAMRHGSEIPQYLAWEALGDYEILDVDGNPVMLETTDEDGDYLSTNLQHNHALWGRIDECIASFNKNVYTLTTTDLIKPSLALSRGVTCRMNRADGDLQLRDRTYRIHSYPGIVAVEWRPGEGQGFQFYGDNLIEMPNDADMRINETDAQQGWRWIRMRTPGGDFEKFRNGTTNADAADALLPPPETQLTALVELERGAYSSTPERYDNSNSGQHLELQYAVVQSRENLAEQFEYTLNCLCEYNNQTVLMDSTRGKPLHFQNNVPV